MGTEGGKNSEVGSTEVKIMIGEEVKKVTEQIEKKWAKM